MASKNRGTSYPLQHTKGHAFIPFDILCNHKTPLAASREGFGCIITEPYGMLFLTMECSCIYADSVSLIKVAAKDGNPAKI